MNDRRDGDESEERGGKLVVARGNFALTFECSKEVLNQVAFTVVAPVKGALLFAGGIEGEAREDVVLDQQHAKVIRVVGIISGQYGAAGLFEPLDQLGGHADVSHIAGAQEEPDHTALSVDNGVDFGGCPASARPHGLELLPSGGIGSTAIYLHVGSIHEVDPAVRSSGQSFEQVLPDAVVPPPGKVAINRSPVQPITGQVPLGASRPQHV